MSVRPSVGLHEYFPTSRGVTVARVNSETVRAAPLSVSTLIPPRAACEQCKQSKCNVKFGTQRNWSSFPILVLLSSAFSLRDAIVVMPWWNMNAYLVTTPINSRIVVYIFAINIVLSREHTRHAHYIVRAGVPPVVDRTNITIEKRRECGKLNKSPGQPLRLRPSRGTFAVCNFVINLPRWIARSPVADKFSAVHPIAASIAFFIPLWTDFNRVRCNYFDRRTFSNVSLQVKSEKKEKLSFVGVKNNLFSKNSPYFLLRSIVFSIFLRVGESVLSRKKI